MKWFLLLVSIVLLLLGVHPITIAIALASLIVSLWEWERDNYTGAIWLVFTITVVFLDLYNG